jgi:hypothetical protein
VFICDVRASKHQIKAAVKALYNIPAISVNTLVRPAAVLLNADGSVDASFDAGLADGQGRHRASEPECTENARGWIDPCIAVQEHGVLRGSDAGGEFQ